MIPFAKTSPVPPETCHLACAIEQIGDRWTMLILRSALFGVRRFDHFQAELSIPRTILSGRLAALTRNGLLEKRPYKEDGKRSRPEYVLTDKAEALRPVMIALMQWGDDWLADGEAPPLRFTQATTRQPVHAAFVNADGARVETADIRVALRR